MRGDLNENNEERWREKEEKTTEVDNVEFLPRIYELNISVAAIFLSTDL
jgi:hypothetical protein